MTCPNCRNEIKLTWRKYFFSPLGKHRCDRCSCQFKIRRHILSYLDFVPLGVLTVGIGIALNVWMEFSITSAITIAVIFYCLIAMPLDKKLDDKYSDSEIIKDKK